MNPSPTERVTHCVTQAHAGLRPGLQHKSVQRASIEAHRVGES
ncbi:MAG: hypothetical protein QNJ78_09610 [Gammaproteobacteria bacterium]|nr:hypothetical protein [Gammaproteobacteria bacterium]